MTAGSRAVLIVQARMGSTRLPGKSMLDLAGAPLLARVLERLVRCRETASVILATTEEPEDDVLVNVALAHGVDVFRGAKDDLVDRYHRAAEAHDADIVVRVPADNPTPEPEEIDRIVRYHRDSSNVFSSNLAQVFGNGYPDGIGAEVIDTSALAHIWRTEHDPHRREHPHLNFFDYEFQQPTNPQFAVGTIECPSEFRRPDLVLDVNTAEEYEFMRELYEYLYPRNPRFHVTDVIRWYDEVWTPSLAHVE